MNFPHRKESAFTLVEMSIVLVIIGLIIGGIIVGQGLIAGARIKNLITDFRRYTAAVNTFKDKYNALPGDMSNATTVWGVVGGDGTGNDAACKTIPSTGMGTCNGNGDNLIVNSTASYEYFRFWQHLANAGLIEGQFAGVPGNLAGYSYTFVSGVTTPATKIRGSSWIPNYSPTAGVSAGTTAIFAGDYGNHLDIYNPSGQQATLSLTPTEAWTIDAKLDDGMPGTGTVIGYKGNATYLCTNMANVAAGSDTGAIYNLSDANADCYISFVRLF